MRTTGGAARPHGAPRAAASVTPARANWSSLPPKAKAFRVAHGIWSVAQLTCLWYIWRSAWRRERDRRLAAAIGFLMVEGGALIVGRGNCPFGPFQRELGDATPFFELILPPRAAKAAIPFLAAVSLAGLAAVLLRPPRSR